MSTDANVSDKILANRDQQCAKGTSKWDLSYICKEVSRLENRRLIRVHRGFGEK